MNAPFLSAEGRGGVADFLFHPETPVSEARPKKPGVSMEVKLEGVQAFREGMESAAESVRQFGELVKAGRRPWWQRLWPWSGVKEEMGAMERRLRTRTEQVEVLKARVEKLVAENGRLHHARNGLAIEKAVAELAIELASQSSWTAADQLETAQREVAMWRNRALFWKGKVGEVQQDAAHYLRLEELNFAAAVSWAKRADETERDRATLEEKFQLVDAAERCASERVRLLEDDKRALLDEVEVLREQVRLAIAGPGDLNREGAESAEDSPAEWLARAGAESDRIVDGMRSSVASDDMRVLDEWDAQQEGGGQ